jgi:hypothetical protein
VLFKALAKSPDERFGSAREMAAALRALQPQPENDVRASLAALLKNDFGRELAELLGIESLGDRDDAWRRAGRPISSAPPPAQDPLDSTYRHDLSTSNFSDVTTGGGQTTQGPTAVEGRRSMTSLRPASELPSLRPPPPSLRPLPAPSAATATSPGLGAPVPKPVRSTSPLAWAMAVLGAGLLVFVAIQGARPSPPPKIRVVSQENEPLAKPAPSLAASTRAASLAQSPSVVPLKPQPTLSTPTPTKAGESKPAGHGEPARPRASRAEPGSLGARRLTHALRKQQEQFTACFVQHAKTLTNLPPIKLEFELSADGKLSAVHVLPAALAGTALGRCLNTAASAAQFPALGKPVSFTVPLSASLGQAPPPPASR